MIREVILSADDEVAEQIKWNNPSFYYNGPMASFDAKEYKRDIAVMNLYKNRIMLVLPNSAKINDPTNLLTGDYKDGRRLIVFNDFADVQAKANALQVVIKAWLALVDKS